MNENYIVKNNITAKDLKDYGFYYKCGDFCYKLPCYKCNEKVLIWANMYINLDNKQLTINIKDVNGTYYPYYINNNNNKVSEIINKNLNKEINKLMKKGIIENMNKKRLGKKDYTSRVVKHKPTINIKKINKHAITPTYGTEYAAGADLYAIVHNNTNIVEILPGETAFIGTGLEFEIPQGYVGLIYARSGMACKNGLAPANKVGVIDSDYRGEIMVALYNQSNETKVITSGDRIAQMIIQPVTQFEFNEVNELSDTMRGEDGFGSTGRGKA